MLSCEAAPGLRRSPRLHHELAIAGPARRTRHASSPRRALDHEPPPPPPPRRRLHVVSGIRRLGQAEGDSNRARKASARTREKTDGATAARGTDKGFPPDLAPVPAAAVGYMHHVGDHSTTTTAGDNVDRTSLPTLLDHLVLSSSSPFPFPIQPSSVNFTFDNPTRPLSSSSSSPKRDLAACDRHSNHSTRIKKRKVLHTFYRSPALLLSGPPPASSSSSTDTGRPTRTRLPSSPARPTGGPTRRSSWWASASRCEGESNQSRFGPSEAVWSTSASSDDADGRAWLSVFEPAPSSPPAIHRRLGFELELARKDGGGLCPSRPTSPRATTTPASSCSQSSGGPQEEAGGDPEGGGGEAAEEQAVSGPALKKLLLLSLRQKWKSEGGPTSAGEAALRFKKWVMWNAWRIETQGNEPEYFGEFLGDTETDSDDLIDPDDELDDTEIDSCSDEEDEGDSYRDPTTIVPSEYYITGSDSICDDDDDAESALTPPLSSYAGGCVFSLTGQMIDLSLPSPPRSPPKRPIALPPLQNAYLSASIPDTEPSSSSPSPSPSRSPCRPGLRRSTTVPTSFSTHSSSNSHSSSSSSDLRQ